MSKNKLYIVIVIACLSGFLYLFYNINYSESSNLRFCFFKKATGYPCPSCGSTRAIKMLLKGDFLGSFQMNPFGIIVAILMLILPVWIAFDWATHKQTFYNSYIKTETILKTKWLAVLLIVLVLLNWIWNIKKGL